MATFGLNGRIALVTGGAQGMGREIAERFGREGASVVVGDISEGGGEETVANIVKAGGKAVFQRTDVSKAADVNALVQLALTKYGDLHHAVNAAAIEGEAPNLLELEEENFDRIIAVNLKSIYLSMRAEVKAFVDKGHGGTIVNICSTNSFRPQPGQCAYTASKHGVAGITKTAAIEFAAKGIRINGIAPGSIDTPMLRNAIERRTGDVEGTINRLSLIGRFGTVQEIASAAMWLSCDESTYTMGHILGVDGAYLAR
jgi:NAD(P)-dependent dehydrogenase (short-subunit alcohol dehydrogenase family)